MALEQRGQLVAKRRPSSFRREPPAGLDDGAELLRVQRDGPLGRVEAQLDRVVLERQVQAGLAEQDIGARN